MNDPNVQKAFPMDTAPRDGTMLRLLVQFDDHSTDDTDGPAWTIGYCSKPHPDDDDNWQFAGWCWDHDHFTEGKGTPVGWLPLIDASPKRVCPCGAGDVEKCPGGCIELQDSPKGGSDWEATDADVAAWVARNDLGGSFGSKTDARTAFEDARSAEQATSAEVGA